MSSLPLQGISFPGGQELILLLFLFLGVVFFVSVTLAVVFLAITLANKKK
ncbi:hypothetical protein [Blastopirellula marina]|nr:hypothetical protein [Blastopirellula marina]